MKQQHTSADHTPYTSFIYAYFRNKSDLLLRDSFLHTEQLHLSIRLAAKSH